jgi:formamidopyrimidine-DNA glycosylase
MPELPEVETVMNGLKPHLMDAKVEHTIVRQHQLRWPIPQTLANHLNQQRITALARRGKYLLLSIGDGTLLVHLGMSGSLRLVANTAPIKTHDHVTLHLSTQRHLRFNDPRRFGAMLWTDTDPYQHPLLKSLGPEPLSDDFNATLLQQRAFGRRQAIKSLIMDSKIVVGVGNIYAAEALFSAQIHPQTPAGQLTDDQYQRLTQTIKQTLQGAIQQGGTTIKDFVNGHGKPGYFTQHLNVYGRAGKPCYCCQRPLHTLTIGQRSTVYCEHCQPPVILP